MKKIVGVLLAAWVVAAKPVQAAEDKLWADVATWKIYSSGDACFTYDSYKNGTTLGFSINDAHNFSILFGRDEWQIPEGVYKISIDLDGTGAGTVDASGKGQIIKASFLMTDENVRKVRRTHTLTAGIGKQKFSFHLVGTDKMFPELIKCSQSVLKSLNNPFTGEAATQPSSDPVVQEANPF